MRDAESGIPVHLFYRADYDLPYFFGPIISGMMALLEKGRADEKEPIY
jgi:hypothetical protein